MTHIRTQIRHRFEDVLDAALPAGYVIFGSRKFKRNSVTGQAIIDIRCLNDQTSEREVTGSARVHVASIYIRIQRRDDETVLDDNLDADEVLVAKAIAAEPWGDLLEEEPELLQVGFSDESTSDQASGAIVLRYDVEYRIHRADPETAIP